jgi:hypothetical protein
MSMLLPEFGQYLRDNTLSLGWVTPYQQSLMTGFLATLTPEQRAAALAYDGDDHLGGPDQ